MLENGHVERALQHLLLKDHFPKSRMAFVVGPRQVGKTTLAMELLRKRNSTDLYRSWDDIDWRRALSRDPYGFVDAFRSKSRAHRPLVALDEVHRFPRWKQYLKGLWDTRGDRLDVIVTGSGRLDVYQRGGDSLLGRYHQYRLHPLSVREVVDPSRPAPNYRPDQTLRRLTGAAGPPSRQSRDAFEALLRWGGFPAPFLAKNARDLRRWHRQRRQLIVREDLRDLSRIHLLSHVEEMVELLVDRSGGILTYNSLRKDLQVALDSVRLWVGYLERLYFIYRVRPYAGRMARALRREPKLYLWDWSEVSDHGARFENLIASHLLKWCHFSQDWGHEALELYFVRDKEKREVDFLVTREKKPWLLIEAKLSNPNPEPAMHYFAQRLGVKHKLMVVANLVAPGMAADVHVLDGPTFLAMLPV